MFFVLQMGESKTQKREVLCLPLLKGKSESEARSDASAYSLSNIENEK